MANKKMSGKGAKKSVSVKAKKDTMAKNVSDHMGSSLMGKGLKVKLSGGKSGGKKK